MHNLLIHVLYPNWLFFANIYFLTYINIYIYIHTQSGTYLFWDAISSGTRKTAIFRYSELDRQIAVGPAQQND